MTMSPRLVLLRSGLACSLIAGGCVPALAQQPGTSPSDLAILSLEELMRITVTTASKKSESLFDAPAIMVVLTERDLQSYGGRSLVEILDRTTSVFFMGTQENLQGALTMRGDATLGSNNHILVLVNGRPIQESTYGGMIHPFLRSFPVASVRQVEIIRGPGSVLYGTNAYVGVINVITKDWGGSGAVSVSYGTFNTKVASAAGGTTLGALKVSAGLAVSHDAGWNFTATDSVDTDKAAITRTVPWFDRKVGANLNAGYGGFTAAMFLVRAQTPHLTNSSATTSWARYGRSEASQAMVDVGYDRKIAARWTSSLHATYNHFFERIDFGEIGTREILSNTYGIEWTNNLVVTDAVNVVVGGNLSRRTGSMYEATPAWYGVPSYHRHNFTAFAQVDYRPIPRLKLIAGGQLIKIPSFTTHVTGGESGTVSTIPGLAPRFVGRLGAVVTLTQTLGAKLLYSEAFRQPSVIETDRVRFDDGEYTQEGNPSLKPEAIATTDLQVYYGNERVNAAVTAFDSRQSNVIAETDAFDLIQNFDRSRTRGIEAEALLRPGPRVDLSASMTYQRIASQADGVFSGVAVPVPRFMGKFGIAYRAVSGVTLGLHDSYFGTPKESRHVDDEYPANNTQRVNPTARAFHNVTANLTYRWRNVPGLRPDSDVTAQVYGSNLLGGRIYYAEFTSVNVNSIPGRPGRAVFAGVTVGF
jgi:outer membrane receptor for ferrienterochelin and colicins